MKISNSRPSRFHYAFLQKILTYASMLLTAAIVGAFLYLAEKYQLAFLRGCGVMMGLVGLFITFFTVREVIYRMEEEGTLLFRNAALYTLNNYVLHLCFIPVVGPHIERLFVRGKRANPFVTDDDNSKEP